jgi:hypothetical protein
LASIPQKQLCSQGEDQEGLSCEDHATRFREIRLLKGRKFEKSRKFYERTVVFVFVLEGATGRHIPLLVANCRNKMSLSLSLVELTKEEEIKLATCPDRTSLYLLTRSETSSLVVTGIGSLGHACIAEILLSNKISCVGHLQDRQKNQELLAYAK